MYLCILVTFFYFIHLSYFSLRLLRIWSFLIYEFLMFVQWNLEIVCFVFNITYCLKKLRQCFGNWQALFRDTLTSKILVYNTFNSPPEDKILAIDIISQNRQNFQIYKIGLAVEKLLKVNL